jgi:mono/diheme cytochrome c family protein
VRGFAVAVMFASVVAAGSAQRAPEPVRQPARPSAKTPLAPAQPATADGFDKVVKPFISQNCFTCHGDKKQEQGLNLQAIAAARSLLDHGEKWEEVVGKLRGKEMPPIEEEQPEEADRQAVATWIANELARLDRVTPPNPGRVTARRLNRTEYNNTVRDLLGVDIRPADDFPQDDAGYGFDNIADVLSLSPVLMEKYVTAADRVSRQALFGPPAMAPTLIKLRSEGRRVQEARTVPASYDVTGLSLPNAFHSMHRVPVDGEYVIKVTLGGLRPKASMPVPITLWIDQKELQTTTHDQERAASFEIDRQDFGGQSVQFRVRLTAGDRWIAVAIPRIYEGLPPRFGGPNPSTRSEPPREFKPPPNVPADRLAMLKKRFEESGAELAKIPLNGVRVNAVEVGGPYSYTKGPSRDSRLKVYTCGHLDGAHTSTCPARIMTDLARRAFRRPVATTELAKYVALVKTAQKEEGSFEEGLAVGIQALLVSPDFLFRIERDRPARAGATVSSQRIAPHEMATRLSYFLWASMPDDELRRAADAGTLRDPAVVAYQVRRMLRDPRSRALAEHFGGQWLQFRALESVTRDRDRFPEFEDYLRLSMRRETEMFVDHIVRQDRPVLDFIEGRYSFLNERLARHYAVPNVVGPEFRQVDLSATPRGGVLTHGSVLTVSSYATRTSPVLRGRWVLDNLLNAPPPEPPNDVPSLEDSKIGKSVTMREQLEEHRKNPTCASCHKRMDPLGFGLENFDAVGAWRTADGTFPIDSTGILPDGRTFSGPDELRAILSSERQAFTRAITSKLLTYALGRGLERYDAKTVNQIAARLPRHKYRFSGLVIEIVNSLPFTSRRPAHELEADNMSTPKPAAKRGES